MGQRRIVTGNSETYADASSVVIDDKLETLDVPGRPGLATQLIWASKETPAHNQDKGDQMVNMPEGLSIANGTKLWVTELEAGCQAPMHRTCTLDYNVITEGCVDLVCENEHGELERTRATAGDVVVQRGNLHAWENPGPVKCRWVTTIIPADRLVLSSGEQIPDRHL